MKISPTISTRIFIFVQLILIAFISVSAITAQSSSVDLSFNAVISKDTDRNGLPAQSDFTLQPDGKILTYGNFQVINGVIKNNIARLNADGRLDNSFDCTACDFSINSVIVQPDGKIIIAGSVYSSATGTSAARLRRLNADGSLDTSFNPTSPINDPVMFPVSYSASVRAIQPDGKILVDIASFSGGGSSDNLYRLNPNGTFDNTFNTINVGGGRFFRTSFTKILLQPDGKILIATNTFGGINFSAAFNRYNADGTLDSTFEPPTFTGSALATTQGFSINDFELLPDGSIVIVGFFKSVNAVSRDNIVKLLPAGNVDLSFVPTNAFRSQEPASGVEIYSDGKILVSTSIDYNPAGLPGTTNRFIRFNTDGSLDNTFTSPANLVLINKFVIDSSDSVLLYGSFTENGVTIKKFARLNLDGSIASSFIVNYGIGGSVTTIAIQPNGKVIVAGDFARVSGISRNKIARLNSDGSLDSSFDPGSGFNNTVETIVIQSDGKVLVGGTFTSFNGIQRNALVRLNSDGSLDMTFDANILNGTVYSIALLTNTATGDEILIGGSFSSVGGQSRNGFARLNPDGSVVAGFNPIFGNPSFGVATIRRVLIQDDGKILVGGTFNGVDGFNRSNLVRLNADGTLDAAFNAGNIGSVSIIELYPNGKYIISSGNGLLRLNNDGTTDATFQSPGFNGSIYAVLVQPDGSIIVGGSFTEVRNIPRQRLVRLRADGSVDLSFFPVGANDTVRAIVSQPDGKLIVGGDFTMIANVTRLAAARLIVAPVRAPITMFDFDGDGKADLSVFRPSNGFWYELRSQNNSFYALQFGQSSDLPAPADYDGDGRTDIAVFRENVPGAGTKSYFYITNSSDNSFRPVQFGTQGDVPISGDWDGDGIADLAVYRNATTAGGQSFFFYRPSSQPGVDFRSIAWGTFGDKAVRGDFDGDGKLDAAVFRPSNTTWYILQSSNNQFVQQQLGVASDIPVPADYDGDGKTDIAVFRPSTGYWFTSTNPQTNFGAVQFGANGDLPVPADYDGDGRADVAVYRPTNGTWYLLQSRAGFTGVQFGTAEDKPIPNVYIR